MSTAMYERPAYGEKRWRRRHQSDGGERTGLAMAIVLVGGLIAGVVIAARLFAQPVSAPSIDIQSMFSPSRSPERAQSGFPAAVAAKPAEAAPAAAAAPQPTVAPTAAPPPVSDRATVAHTDGQGVVLRASPRDNDWTPRGFMDGTAVTILERQGADWVRVQGANGQEGWIPTKYLSR